MSRHWFKVLGASALISVLAPSVSEAQLNPNGWIRSGGWTILTPLLNPYGAGPTVDVLKRNWTGPAETYRNPLARERGTGPFSQHDGTAAPDFPRIDFTAGASTGFGGTRIPGVANPTWFTLAGVNGAFGTTLNAADDLVNFNDGIHLALEDQAIDSDADGNPANEPDGSEIPNDNVMSIAVTFVRNNGGPIVIGVCTASDDSIQVWVNNKCVLNKSIQRGSANACQEVTPALLPSGVSKISMLVWEGGGGHNGRLGLRMPGAPANLIDGNGVVDFLGPQTGILDGQAQYCVDRSVAAPAFNCRNVPAQVMIQGEGPGDLGDMLVLTETVLGANTAISDVSNGGTVADIVQPDDGIHQTTSAALTYFVLGPIANPGGAGPGDPAVRAGYLSIADADVEDLDEGDVVNDINGNPLTVRRLSINNGDGLDFNLVGGAGDNIMHYAWTKLTLAAATDVVIGVGSDDSVQVLVDSVEVIICGGCPRGWGAVGEAQNRSAVLPLSAGDHTIITKTYEGGGGHGVRLLVYRAPPAPDDVGPGGVDCASATEIEPGQVGTGNTVGAAIGTTCDPQGSGALYYEVTGTGALMTATTCGGSDYDTYLAIFHETCDAAGCVGAVDDSCGVQSTISWASVAGDTYFIRVYGWDTSVGNYRLAVSDANTPPAPGPSPLTGAGVCADPDGDCDTEAEIVNGRTITWQVERRKLNDPGVSYTADASGTTTHSGNATDAGDNVVAIVGGSASISFLANDQGQTGKFTHAHDFGTPPTPGFTIDNGGGSYTVAGSGSDIWDGGDHMHFAYKEVEGDFQATVRVAEVRDPPNNRWGRHGIMARYTCDFNSKYSMACMPFRGEGAARGQIITAETDTFTDNDSRRHQSRRDHLNSGTTRDEQEMPAFGQPLPQNFTGWLRLNRCGNFFYSEFAADEDGEPGEWQVGGGDYHENPPDAVLLGLCSSSHGSGGANLLIVEYENYECIPKTWPQRWSQAIQELVSEDFNDNPNLNNLVTTETITNNFVPTVVAGRLRVTAAATGGTAAAVYLNAPGAGDLDLAISYNLFYNGAGNPADGGGFAMYENARGFPTAGNVIGGGGGAQAFQRGGENGIPNDRTVSWSVEIDNWDGGHGSNDPPGGHGSNAGNPAFYHMGINVNANMQSVVNNVEFGAGLPPIFNNGTGLFVEIAYDPNPIAEKPHTALVTVWATHVQDDQGAGYPSVQGAERTMISRAYVPRIDGNAIFAFHGATGGATADLEFDNFTISAACSEQPDRVTISGCPEAEVGVGDGVTLTAVGSGADGAVTYTWSVDGVVVGGVTGDTLDYVCRPEGEHTVTVVCEDEVDCCPGVPAECTIVCVSVGPSKAPCDWNNDGGLDLSDAVGLLNHLFLGGPPHKCGPINSAGTIALIDANGDGAVDLSDAVGKLNFLFLGGPAPRPIVAAGGLGSCLLVPDCEDPVDSCP